MIGRKLNQYEVIAQLGQGGMGEVFRARDSSLDREVAIKVLPREMSGDPERIARFQREARTLGSLQHPNIAAVYGFEEVEGVRFLAMELVEGANLADRLQAGPFNEDDAREIIGKIAAGLAEAHRSGIMHRDLKPANVMLTPEGEVKILDFGLARAYTGDSEDAGDPAMSPTITAAMTQAGTILGTASYMAPEQARGRRVDHRADIWAMGVIFFEMLAGRRLFDGETVTDVLASVITAEPDLDALPRGIRPSTRRMLRKCLQRDPARRLHSAADAALELDEPDRVETVAASAAGSSRFPWIVVALVVVSALALQFLGGSSEAPVPEPRVYQLNLASRADPTYSYRPGISPDGRFVVTLAVDSIGQRRLHIRSLVDGSARLLGPEVSGSWPFWSPDSKFIGHFDGNRLRKLHVESGSVETITEVTSGLGRGGTWSEEGLILYAPNANSGLRLVDAGGGAPRVVTQLDTILADGSHRWPMFLPDGRRFVYTLWSNVLQERQEFGGVYLGDLDGAAPRRLLRDVSGAVVVKTGQLMFHRNNRLMAVGFDPESGEVSGEPQLVSERVGFVASNGALAASASDAGDIVLFPFSVSMQTQLGWMDRDGRRLDDVGPLQPAVIDLKLSRTDRHYVVELLDDVGSVEVWIGDLERNSLSRLSNFDSDCWGTNFSPDGREVAYAVQTMDGGQLYRHRVSGGTGPELVLDFDNETRIFDVDHWAMPELIVASFEFEGRDVIGICSIDTESGEVSELLVDGFDQGEATLSPDGRWLAYVSEETGRPEVYVRSWPDLAQKWQISREGAIAPDWSIAGDRLLFVGIQGPDIREVEFVVRDAGGPEIGLPVIVTAIPPGVGEFAPASGLDRFLLGFMPDQVDERVVKVLVGWGANARRSR